MKVSTKYPIIINSKKINKPSDYLSAEGEDDDFFNAGGDLKAKFKTATQNLKQNPNVQGFGQDLKTGLFNKLGLNVQPNQPNYNPPPNYPAQPTGMSTGAKIGIAVGALLVIAGIVYAVKKK